MQCVHGEKMNCKLNKAGKCSIEPRILNTSDECRVPLCMSVISAEYKGAEKHGTDS
jgi:hypothetical protein